MKIVNETGFFFPVDMKYLEEEAMRVNFQVSFILVDLVYDYFRVMVCGEHNTGKLSYVVSKDIYEKSIDSVLNATTAYWGHSFATVNPYLSYEWDWIILGESKKGEVYPFGLNQAKGFFLRVANDSGLNTPSCVTYNREHIVE